MKQNYHGHEYAGSRLFTGGKGMAPVPQETIEKLQVTTWVCGVPVQYVKSDFTLQSPVLPAAGGREVHTTYQVMMQGGMQFVCDYNIFPYLLEPMALPQWVKVKCTLMSDMTLHAAPIEEQEL